MILYFLFPIIFSTPHQEILHETNQHERNFLATFDLCSNSYHFLEGDRVKFSILRSGIKSCICEVSVSILLNYKDTIFVATKIFNENESVKHFSIDILKILKGYITYHRIPKNNILEIQISSLSNYATIGYFSKANITFYPRNNNYDRIQQRNKKISSYAMLFVMFFGLVTLACVTLYLNKVSSEITYEIQPFIFEIQEFVFRREEKDCYHEQMTFNA
ncbi:hypothetical protein TRFO_09439 [Tritrichomonas foetus]|uniref:Uncharacterized protein n=1 Tax=Tritrichomonas foetus TaxID=1144522 RepID=A0A1J4JGL0_9EUKA|nr:hypothetical protein TRFO_09439 [Tritrichomonas foetus]|eukprot:OHS97439.1 hypothetical protein TRFO_09439 [Tritrichomonas foetus]